jgi:hypothetical protein
MWNRRSLLFATVGLPAVLVRRSSAADSDGAQHLAQVGERGTEPASPPKNTCAAVLPGLIAGLEPDKLGPTKLRVRPGSCATAVGRSIISLSSAVEIDLNRVGVLGRDAGVLEDKQEYYLYILRDARTGAGSILASTSRNYGGVTVPLGFEVARKLRFGVVFDSKRWGGIPDFHIAHWPSPLVTFTQFEDSAKWDALTEGTSSSFARLSLEAFLPDNARLARVQTLVHARYKSGAAYLRTFGGQPTGILVGGASPIAGVASVQTMDVRVSSTRQLEYRVSGGASLTVRVVGYSMTEPS